MSLEDKKTGLSVGKTGFLAAFGILAAGLSCAHLIMRPSRVASMRYIMGFAPEDCMRLVDFHFVMLLCLGIICFAALYGLIYTKLSYERLFTFCAMGFGLLYLIGLTPLAVPDEATHFSTVYELACRLPGCSGIDDRLHGLGFANHDSVCNGYLRVLNEFGRAAAKLPTDRSGELAISGMWTLVYVVEYVPQIIGTALAMLLGRNMVTAFLLGRFFNLLFYCLCLYLAIKRSPRFKLMFGFVGLMPMALQQAASLSYDCFVNALTLVLLSSILKAMYDESPMPLKEFLFILVTAVVLTPAKGVYGLFALLFLFVPKERFPLRGKGKGFWAAVLLGSCVGFFALISLPQILRILGNTRPGFESTGESLNTVGLLLADPMRGLRIFADTFNVYIVDWLGDAIGGELGTYAIKLPAWILPCYFACMLLSVQNRDKDYATLPRGFRSCCLGISAFIILAFMLTMYFAWISTEDNIIYGVQGRYFTPVIALLLLAANSDDISLRPRYGGKGICVLVILLSARALAEVFTYTMQHVLG